VTLTIGFALLAGAILLFWCTVIGTRLAQPPRWTGDTMVICFIAPVVIMLGVAGAGVLVHLVVSGTWRSLGASDFVGVGAEFAAAFALGLGLRRWSRRAPRARSAEVIPLERPESPEPPRPAPMLGRPRKAA
jgi:hypothetical protein